MRLFIATPLSRQVESELANIIYQLKNVAGNVKWVKPENIHLTIKFLGETDESLVNPLSQLIDETSRETKISKYTISKLGGFPNLIRPRALWAGLDGDRSELERLASLVDERVHELGYEKETRKFRPHLTLGRFKKPQAMPELADFIDSYKIEPMRVQIDRLTLFKSTLTPRGPIYERLHEAMFKQN